MMLENFQIVCTWIDEHRSMGSFLNVLQRLQLSPDGHQRRKNSAVARPSGICTLVEIVMVPNDNLTLDELSSAAKAGG